MLRHDVATGNLVQFRFGRNVLECVCMASERNNLRCALPIMLKFSAFVLRIIAHPLPFLSLCGDIRTARDGRPKKGILSCFSEGSSGLSASYNSKSDTVHPPRIIEEHNATNCAPVSALPFAPDWYKDHP